MSNPVAAPPMQAAAQIGNSKPENTEPPMTCQQVSSALSAWNAMSDFKEMGQRVLAWVSPDEAARRVREVELKSMLVNFKPIDD